MLHLSPQVKGYRYLEEDNSDESDSERSEEDNQENREHVLEEMGAEGREERGQDGGAHGADSPIARRRGAAGHHQNRDVNVNGEEREEREGL